MDALSQILDSVALRGSLYFPTEFRSPWGLLVPANTNVCRFHVAVDGGCYLTAGSEEVYLSRGDLALVPHGRDHLLQDRRDAHIVDLDEALHSSGYSGQGCFSWGGEGTPCRLVCGHFDFDKEMTHPLLNGLPSIVHVRATPTYDFRWLDQVMRFIGEETQAERPGGDVIARRLSEVLFVQVLRHYAESSEEPVPFLAGITDPQLSRALQAMHRSLHKPWTLEELARVCAMSRSVFTQQFAAKVGETPMQYLTQQRMREACRLLRLGYPAGDVAERVGYRSEAAFHRKFKTFVGFGPGAYRRTHAAKSAQRWNRRQSEPPASRA